eukprot:scaffold781_cov132-Cylindrotheca_fusiformis.AAC.24
MHTKNDQEKETRDDSAVAVELSKVSLENLGGGSNQIVQEEHNDSTKMLLSKLLNSRTIADARRTMRLFSSCVDRCSKTGRDNSNHMSFVRSIVESNGTTAIVVALDKWYKQSEEFTLLAVGVLVNIVFHDPESNSVLAGIGGIQTIFRVVQKYPDSRLVVSDAVELFCSLAGYDSTRREVAKNECINFVIHSMRKFPREEDIQLEGCEYFLEIGKIDGMKKRIRDKKIGALLGKALDNFRDEFSRKAALWYAEE